MTGEQIEKAKRSIESQYDPIEESIKQEALEALYANYVYVLLQEHKKLLPNTDHKKFEEEVRQEIIKLAEAIKDEKI